VNKVQLNLPIPPRKPPLVEIFQRLLRRVEKSSGGPRRVKRPHATGPRISTAGEFRRIKLKRRIWKQSKYAEQ
jgi:hypothetical protein